MNAQRIGVVCVAAAGMLGTFLPWASLGIISASGTVGDGWITLGLFTGALLIAVLGKRAEPMSGWARLGIVALAAGTAVVGLHDASGLLAIGSASTVGAGLYLACIAAIVLGLVASFGGHWSQPIALSLVLLGTVAAGFVHVVTGARVGTKLCRKGSWTLVNTFVDLDTFDGKPIFGMSKERLAVLPDLFDCDMLKRPHGADSWGSTCSIDGEPGVCMDSWQCEGTSRPGLCPGGGDVRCCIVTLQTTQ